MSFSTKECVGMGMFQPVSHAYYPFLISPLHSAMLSHVVFAPVLKMWHFEKPVIADTVKIMLRTFSTLKKLFTQNVFNLILLLTPLFHQEDLK